MIGWSIRIRFIEGGAEARGWIARNGERGSLCVCKASVLH